MAISLEDYVIDPAGIDGPAVWKEWAWLLPPEFTLWMVNRLGDLFLVLPDGSVRMLDVGTGSLEKLAESRDDFCTKIDEDGNADVWLAIPLIDALTSAGVHLQPGQCYGYLRLPVFGGAYEIENLRPISLADHLGACGSIHRQIKDLPDGAKVQIQFEE